MWRYRFDYLARDSMHLSIKLGCDFSRILNFSKARMLQHCPSLLAFSRDGFVLVPGALCKPPT